MESVFEVSGRESPIIREMKCLASANLDNRYPVTELHICAFLLDPSQLKININRYLDHHQSTRKTILLSMLKRFKIESKAQASTTVKTPISSSSSPAAAAAQTTEISSPVLKRNRSIEHLQEHARNLKKTRENLIQKHSPAPALPIDPIIAEVDKYLTLEIVCEDVLQFWRSAKDTFPHLRSLAQIVLAIPSTSTPSEQVFSTTGLILNAKRTMLSPESVGKIQVIHDNYSLFKPS